MLPQLVLAAFLVAHAAIHVGFVAPPPPATAGGPAWPFDLGHSWLFDRVGLDRALTRLVGLVLLATTVGGFAIASLATLGTLPEAIWPLAISLGAAASAGLLGLFFQRWLVLGIAIDVALLWAVVVAHWLPA